MKPVFETLDENRTMAEIAVTSSKLNAVRHMLHLLGVPEALPSGIGWQYADGGIIIIGSESSVHDTAEKIAHFLNGPKFLTGLELAEKQKQGAMP